MVREDTVFKSTKTGFEIRSSGSMVPNKMAFVSCWSHFKVHAITHVGKVEPIILALVPIPSLDQVARRGLNKVFCPNRVRSMPGDSIGNYVFSGSNSKYWCKLLLSPSYQPSL